jgi:ribonucleoside-diphosphate reductase subunit M2
MILPTGAPKIHLGGSWGRSPQSGGPPLDDLALEALEPLLTAQQRVAMYPITSPDIWAAYKAQQASIWNAEEVDFSRDKEQWDKRLNDGERHFLTHILAFFAGADTVVSLNLMERFCSEVRVLEAQCAYALQAFMENVHAETYSIMIDVYIQDADQKDALLSSLGGLDVVRQKVDWATKWKLSGTASFARRLVGLAIVEGLFFSGAFCAIYWFKERNLLPGLTKSNEFIARDEGQHTAMAALLYSKILYTRLSQEDVHAMFREAVGIEKDFINRAIPCSLIGMTPALMSTYIEHVADNLLKDLRYDPIYGSESPFEFMNNLGMGARSNFFEERVSLYSRPAHRVAGQHKAAAQQSGAGGGILCDDF